MTDEKLRLPRSSYEELCKIIKAYGRSPEPASIDEIAALSGIPRTRVSANNAFLVAVEIVEGTRSKSPTPKGSDLARALEHDMPEQISRAWRKVIDENDFLNKMVQAVSIRRGMEASHLENHIAYSAGEPKSKEVMTGARAVIDILKASKMVREEGDQILPTLKIQSSADGVLMSGPLNSIEIDEEKGEPEIHVTSISRNEVSLSIQVRIDVSVDELDGLGEKLRGLLNSISESKTDSTNSENVVRR